MAGRPNTTPEANYCPFCDEMTGQVMMKFKAVPTDSQQAADDIPSESIPPIRATVCSECEGVVAAHPHREVPE